MQAYLKDVWWLIGHLACGQQISQMQNWLAMAVLPTSNSTYLIISSPQYNTTSYYRAQIASRKHQCKNTTYFMREVPCGLELLLLAAFRCPLSGLQICHRMRVMHHGPAGRADSYLYFSMKPNLLCTFSAVLH